MCAQGSRRERGLWTFSVGGRSTAFFWNLTTLSQMQICDFLYSILVLPQTSLLCRGPKGDGGEYESEKVHMEQWETWKGSVTCMLLLFSLPSLMLLAYTVKVAWEKPLKWRERVSLYNGRCQCFHSELSNLAQGFRSIPRMPLERIISSDCGNITLTSMAKKQCLLYPEVFTWLSFCGPHLGR